MSLSGIDEILSLQAGVAPDAIFQKLRNGFVNGPLGTSNSYQLNFSGNVDRSLHQLELLKCFPSPKRKKEVRCNHEGNCEHVEDVPRFQTALVVGVLSTIG